MFFVAVTVFLLGFLALASANVIVSSINPDELSNMGIETKSW